MTAVSYPREPRELASALGVTFFNPSLLEEALTHGSYEDPAGDVPKTNERLEFLGDAVLKLVISEYTFLEFCDLSEGDLTKIVAHTVSEKTLVKAARRLHLGEFLLLGKGQALAGRDQPSILADAFESVVGALYIDHGLEVTRDVILRELASEANLAREQRDVGNYKAMLQETIQRVAKEPPVYRVTEEIGPDHDKEFVVEVVYGGMVKGTGRGKSKKEAEQAAAKVALEGEGNARYGSAWSGCPRY